MTDVDNAGVRAVITLGVLALAGVLAVVIAKIMQFCMRKHYTANDDGDIDDNTRDLIRARLSVIQFKKREIRKVRRDRTFNVFSRWKDFVKNRKKDRDEALKSQRPEENTQVVINIDKVDGLTGKENGVVENGGIKENGSPRITRFPSFTQNKTSGTVKSHPETPRNTTVKGTVVKAELPVPRGRPVSSKQRVAANVTLTDVDVNTTAAKANIKSVHFEDDTDLIKTESISDKENVKMVSETEKKNKENVNKNKKIVETVTVKASVESEKKAKNKINSVTPINEDPINKTESSKGSVQTKPENEIKFEEKT